MRRRGARLEVATDTLLSYSDRIMSSSSSLRNRVRQHRIQRGWSQAQLAELAGISRTAVSAIEGERLVPSVAAALSLARVLDCSVEQLFGAPQTQSAELAWAWEPAAMPCRFWTAEIDGRTLFYPAEGGPSFGIPHDGVARGESLRSPPSSPADSTLVMACCDPAASLLIADFARRSGFRLLAFHRSSRQALDLLQNGLVHVAGVHFATAERPAQNATVVKQSLGEGFRLLRAARWSEGVALSPTSGVRSIRGALGDKKLRWVGREEGSAARECLDELCSHRLHPRRVAFDHRGVAEAIRCGWADAGVCLQIACDEVGLRFLSVREEVFDLCYSARHENDPRVRALVDLVSSAEYRSVIGDLPGYRTVDTGEVQAV
jgi:molybdate-binding protein/DNA-binding XRE family transcriptional regulator